MSLKLNLLWVAFACISPYILLYIISNTIFEYFYWLSEHTCRNRFEIDLLQLFVSRNAITLLSRKKAETLSFLIYWNSFPVLAHCLPVNFIAPFQTEFKHSFQKLLINDVLPFASSNPDSPKATRQCSLQFIIQMFTSQHGLDEKYDNIPLTVRFFHYSLAVACILFLNTSSCLHQMWSWRRIKVWQNFSQNSAIQTGTDFVFHAYSNFGLIIRQLGKMNISNSGSFLFCSRLVTVNFILMCLGLVAASQNNFLKMKMSR